MTACWLPLHMHSLCRSVHKMNQNQGHINDHSIWHHRYGLQRTSKKGILKEKDHFNQKINLVILISTQ